MTKANATCVQKAIETFSEECTAGWYTLTRIVLLCLGSILIRLGSFRLGFLFYLLLEGVWEYFLYDLLRAIEDHMFGVRDAFCANVFHSEEAKGQIGHCECEIDANNGPAVFPGQFLEACAEGVGLWTVQVGRWIGWRWRLLAV